MHLNNTIRRENKERSKSIMEKLTLRKDSGGFLCSGSHCNLLLYHFPQMPSQPKEPLFSIFLGKSLLAFLFLHQQHGLLNYKSGHPCLHVQSGFPPAEKGPPSLFQKEMQRSKEKLSPPGPLTKRGLQCIFISVNQNSLFPTFFVLILTI